MERARPRERVAAVLAGLGELENLRHAHETLVRSALRGVDAHVPPVEKKRHAESFRSREERSAQENLVLLRRQLDCLRSRDAALISQLQELDRQISSLRLDRDESHDQEISSRPSSGFYDLSDASLSLSNSSNSVFSECLSSCQSTSCFCPVHCCLEGRVTLSGETGQGWEEVVSPVVPCPTPLTQTRFPRPQLPSFPPAPSQRRLDLYILSLLQRRVPRPGLPRTRPRPSAPAVRTATAAAGPWPRPPDEQGGGAAAGRSPAPQREGGGVRGGVSSSRRRRRVVRATKLRSSSRESLSSRRHKHTQLDSAPHGRPPRTKRAPDGAGPQTHGLGGRHSNRAGSKRPSRGRSDSEYSAECCSLLEDLMEDRPPRQGGGGGAWGRGRGRPAGQEERSFVKIKASHNLKKKILRFRTGSLKLMTTV